MADPEIHRRQLEVTFPPRRILEELWQDPSRRRHHPRSVILAADRLRAELDGAVTGEAWSRVARRKQAAADRVTAMERYATRRRCRRRALLEYFGEKGDGCSGCDVCGMATGTPAKRGVRALFRVF